MPCCGPRPTPVSIGPRVTRSRRPRTARSVGVPVRSDRPPTGDSRFYGDVPQRPPESPGRDLHRLVDRRGARLPTGPGRTRRGPRRTRTRSGPTATNRGSSPDPIRRHRRTTSCTWDTTTSTPARRPFTSRSTRRRSARNPCATDRIGTSSECCVNPGLRLATDHRSGAIYAVWEVATFNSAASPQILVHYRLNRSTDGGKTWSLNGSSTGIQLAAVPSDQLYDSFTGNPMKFGTVNALFGGIDSVAVDPTTGDVYVVYGRRDTSTSKNRLEVIRLRKNASGGLTPGSARIRQRSMSMRAAVDRGSRTVARSVCSTTPSTASTRAGTRSSAPT